MTGLIFISNEDIISQHNYENPELITLADTKHEKLLEKYSYANKDNLGGIIYTTKITHSFEQHCEILYALSPYFNWSAICYAILFLVWVLFVFQLRKQSTQPVQKILTLIPVLKGLESLLYAIDYNQCPWCESNLAAEAYLKMGKVTSVTFTYTFIHAFFYMLCKGWSITNHGVDRNQATNLTIVMGLVYLVYSAYFLSADFAGMMTFVNFVLAVIYFILGINNIKCLYT